MVERICNSALPFDEPGVVVACTDSDDLGDLGVCLAQLVGGDRHVSQVPAQRWATDAVLHATPEAAIPGSCSRVPLLLHRAMPRADAGALQLCLEQCQAGNSDPSLKIVDVSCGIGDLWVVSSVPFNPLVWCDE